jgi:hypothetical protein
MPELPKKLKFSIIKQFGVEKDQPIETTDQIYYPESIWNDLKLKFEEKEKQYAELNADYHKLKEDLETKIDDLKKELTGNKREIKRLTQEKNEWETRYKSNLEQWSIESLEDKKYSHYASWVNPYSKKTEGKYIPKNFNPHHKNRIDRDKRDYYTIYYKVGEKNRKIKLHKSLFEKLKNVIKPKKEKPVQARISKDKKRNDLVMVNDLNDIKKIYADKDKSEMITEYMETIAEIFLENKGIPFSTGNIKKIIKCDPKTLSNHLKLMYQLRIIEKPSHGKWLMLE